MVGLISTECVFIVRHITIRITGFKCSTHTYLDAAIGKTAADDDDDDNGNGDDDNRDYYCKKVKMVF